ncbi:MAG: tetratricopeptide repeat protein [Pseudomonadota bacterium]
MREDLPSGRVALLMTDIEGSTRLLHRLGAEGYAQAQAEHRDLLRQSFTHHAGVEVDTQGDAFFYAFPDAHAAVLGAVAGTRALAGHPWSHGNPVRVRMGMHSGEPQPTEEGYVGLVVNLAARVSAIGHGGQILLSEAAQQEVVDLLEADDLTLRDLGQHRLKDIEAPERLFQIVIPELPSDFPPPRSAETKPANLPIPLTPFIGRSREIAEVRDLLLEPRIRAVTLLGPGGTGKSRLGLRVANELLHSLEDGAFFVGLATVRDPALVLPSIASSLGVKEQPGQDLLQTLTEHLAPKELLLLMDNFEQVQRAARDIAQLQAACPGLKILATSRQPLRLSGERAYPVPPMGLPGPEEALDDLSAVANFEAVRLFIERAESAQWDFELTASNVADVVAICRKLDALPLAIELATARLYSMNTAQLLAALKNRMAVLTGGSADLLDHQQTLRDLVAWSYDLLDERQQILWRRLAVFDGGGPLPAVQAVCDPDEEYLIPLDLDALVTNSLLSLAFDGTGLEDPENPNAGQRFNMLQTLRDFAHEQLKRSGELDALQARHAHWFADLAQAGATGLRSPATALWLKRLDLEQANFRLAMDWSLKDARDPKLAASTAGNLWFYWYQRGLMSEGRDWLGRAVATDSPLGERARSLLGIANLERVQGNPEAARQHCLDALAGFESNADEAGIADAKSQLGTISQYLGDLEAAERYLTDAVSRLRGLGSRGRLSFTLVVLGGLKQQRDDLNGAYEHYSESLNLGRELGDQNYIATSLVNVGEVLTLKGELAEAARHVRESLALFHTLGVRPGVTYCLEMLAEIELGRGRYEDAAQLYGAGDRLREVLHTPVEAFNETRYRANLEQLRGELGEAAFTSAFAVGRSEQLDTVVNRFGG